MSEKDYNKLLEWSQRLVEKKVTKEEALQSFIRAGILDESGEFTAPYSNLAAACKKLVK